MAEFIATLPIAITAAASGSFSPLGLAGTTPLSDVVRTLLDSWNGLPRRRIWLASFPNRFPNTFSAPTLLGNGSIGGVRWPRPCFGRTPCTLSSRSSWARPRPQLLPSLSDPSPAVRGRPPLSRSPRAATPDLAHRWGAVRGGSYGANPDPAPLRRV